MSSQNFTYRKDIDGMRAIAVWLVVLFHAGLSSISGGYVGVDVFFVLSGYLITQQIYSQCLAGQFTFKQFYLRRIRRIIPVYFFVLICSSLLAYFVLLPEEFIDHVKLAGLAFLSVGNFYIANTSGGYFEQAAESIFLLHSWSLAVEEQFYFVWPIMLIGLLKFFREKLITVIILLLFASIALSEYMSLFSPDKAYYLLPARFFELLIGGALAIRGGGFVAKRVTAGLLAAIGLAMILISAFLFDNDTTFPGINAAVPCIGTAFLLIAGLQQYRFRWLLELPVMVFFGKISYSMYLWHWVVFSFYRYAYGEMTFLAAVLLIFATILLSFISWKIVELPFRYKRTADFKLTFATAVMTPIAILTALYLYVDKNKGFPDKFANAEYIATINSKQMPVNRHCVSEGCPSMLLIGDSHAGQFMDFVNILAIDADMTLDVRLNAACAPIKGVMIGVKKRGGLYEYNPRGCVEFINEALMEIPNFDYIVLGAFWEITQVMQHEYFYVEQPGETPDMDRNWVLLEQGLRKTLTLIAEAGAKPILILDNVTMPEGQVHCVRRKLITGYNKKMDCRVPIEFKREQQQASMAILTKLMGEFPEMFVLDPNRMLCDSTHCHAHKWGIPFYKDRDHLYHGAVIKMSRHFLESEGNPFNSLVNQ